MVEELRKDGRGKLPSVLENNALPEIWMAFLRPNVNTLIRLNLDQLKFQQIGQNTW